MIIITSLNGHPDSSSIEVGEARVDFGHEHATSSPSCLVRWSTVLDTYMAQKQPYTDVSAAESSRASWPYYLEEIDGS